ncbi:MAG: ATP-binding cassette domain-containing protein, partial [Gammaproteobacteria bacterium]|nr:ATP-binding cassette domain-containing protein [Gammaproteobacteria bacterium]
MLELRSISKVFGELMALHKVDLTIPPGKVSGLIGPNGSGKTTLINIITGIYAPDTGQILLNGADVVGSTADQITHRGVGRTFQNIRIFKRMTVLENVLAASISCDNQTLRLLLGRARKADGSRMHLAQEALDTVGLIDESGVIAGDLPLPLRRRLEIARALVRKPQLLLLD